METALSRDRSSPAVAALLIAMKSGRVVITAPLDLAAGGRHPCRNPTSILRAALLARLSRAAMLGSTEEPIAATQPVTLVRPGGTEVLSALLVTVFT
jgi:hypothetical protein